MKIINIDDNRLEGRNPLEQSQLVLYRLLKIFHNICENNGWKYWLDGGTLLGAVRHKGFIPWDDDVDVVMPRKDFEEFKKKGNNLLPKDVFFQNKNTDPTFPIYDILKLTDRYSIIVENVKLAKKITWHQGLNLDIFPCDTIKKSKFNEAKIWGRVLHSYLVYSPNNNYGIKNIIKKFIILIRKYYGWEKIFNIYKNRCVDKNGEILFQLFKRRKTKFFSFKDEIFPLKKYYFIDNYFWGPSNYDIYLKKLYGDYMELPDKENRNFHSEYLSAIENCDHYMALNWNKKNKKVVK